MPLLFIIYWSNSQSVTFGFLRALRQGLEVTWTWIVLVGCETTHLDPLLTFVHHLIDGIAGVVQFLNDPLEKEDDGHGETQRGAHSKNPHPNTTFHWKPSHILFIYNLLMIILLLTSLNSTLSVAKWSLVRYGLWPKGILNLAFW
jgi:hypothetical protein